MTTSAGTRDDYIDFGFAPIITLSDRVWLDEDGDGQREAADSGIGGVSVQLRSNTGTVIGTATSAASTGLYTISNRQAPIYAGDQYSTRVLTPQTPLQTPYGAMLLTVPNAGMFVLIMKLCFLFNLF